MGNKECTVKLLAKQSIKPEVHEAVHIDARHADLNIQMFLIMSSKRVVFVSATHTPLQQM
jgi:hypothetical protein